MTNEEIKLLKNFITWQSLPFVDNLFTHEDEIIKKFNEWLKLNVVEQQPKTDVLDKIRAEIKALSNANPSYWHSGDMVEREDVLEIIDKYIAESEEKK